MPSRGQNIPEIKIEKKEIKFKKMCQNMNADIQACSCGN